MVVVGAGPAGIFTALELIRRGGQKKIVMVEKGVADGDRLIIEGVQKIRPGMEVKSAEVELGADGLVKQKAAPAAAAKAP